MSNECANGKIHSEDPALFGLFGYHLPLTYNQVQAAIDLPLDLSS